MKKINIDKINMRFDSGKYIYIFSLNNNIITVKRIDVVNNKNIVVFNIKDNKVIIKSFPIIKNNIELDCVVNDILSNLKEYNILNDILDIVELEYILKSNYINILISNNIIGLSSYNINNEFSTIDIVLLEDNSIIGNIVYSNGCFNINVSNNYKLDSLNLFNKLMLLFKVKDNNMKKILKNNS